MKKNKEKKKAVWLGSIAAAFVAAVAVFVMMLQTERNALSQFEKEEVFVVTAGIPKGQLLDGETIRKFAERREVDKKSVPDSAIRNLEEIEGMVAVWNVEKGVVLTKGMFERMKDITRNMKDPVIAGLKADDIYQMTGGVLRSGDRIHIYGVDEEGSVSLKWSNVYIQQVFDNAGNIIDASNTTTAAQRINIFIDKNEVEKLYSELSAGSLRAVKVIE